jgi:transposase
MRTGAPWRDLPDKFGPWSTIFNRFNRWSKRGHWKVIFSALKVDGDNEWNFIDATIVKAHQHATGAAKSNKEAQAIGKSVAGNTTKIHMLADSNGNPVHFELSGGQIHDSKHAVPLIGFSKAEFLMADKAYHSQPIREALEKKAIQAVIPIKENSIDKSNPGFDAELYKLRHLVENLFARLKHFRSIATRYEKTARNFASMLYLGCAYIWSKL